MPKFIERKLMAQYGPKSAVPYKVMNAEGMMHGNRETPKGAAMQAKHEAGPRVGKAASLASHPNAARLGKFLHPKKGR